MGTRRQKLRRTGGSILACYDSTFNNEARKGNEASPSPMRPSARGRRGKGEGR
mgnify:CR=1 FL=1